MLFCLTIINVKAYRTICDDLIRLLWPYFKPCTKNFPSSSSTKDCVSRCESPSQAQS